MRRMTAENWAELAVVHDDPAAETTQERLVVLAVAAVLDLGEQLAALAVKYEDLKDREAFNARLEAVRAARDHVSSLPSEQPNSRGYRDRALTSAARVEQELKIARYLLGDET